MVSFERCIDIPNNDDDRLNFYNFVLFHDYLTVKFCSKYIMLFTFIRTYTFRSRFIRLTTSITYIKPDILKTLNNTQY